MNTFRRKGPVNRLCTGAREVPLIELSRVRDDFFLGERIPEQPGLVLSGVTNEDAFFSVRLQLLALVFLYMHISSTAKNAKMGHIRFRTMP